ncbi:hypothetical protein PGTUg99_005384 [Puccinia graminis f. sp. tritici]|uniref:Uncharacterized protein n=1 Tax=Puccinia graminis f. sp. tritici TaxID=56615 RepID=A0A5B0QKT6_PUCGR|nr:hypothetical protein PGTUg99_005384 [Puccinia graminis f. sp. tritici]
MNDDGMETDEETGGAGTNSGAVDDEEFSRILDGESEENDDEDSDSGLEDPEKALKLQQDCQKRKRAQQNSQGTIRKVQRAVVGKKLPSQSGGLSRSIRNFVRFMMGMPATISEYPAAPNRSQWDLWHHWAETRYDKMVKHLAEYTEKHKEVSKSVFKEMYKDEVTHIRKNLSPPAFQAAPDVLNSDLNIPINVKKACEQEVRIAGFGRITFEWEARSFTASPWNATLGSILIKHYFNWAKSQPGTLWDDTSCMELILDRWVKGQGRLMSQAGRQEGKSAEELKAEKARKASISRIKSKIAEKRRAAAIKKMGNQPSLALLFNKETVSDWEDQTPPAKPKRIDLVWRSEAFKRCSHKLDEISLTMTKTTNESKSTRKLLQRDSVEVKPDVEPEFDQIPRKLPEDAYNANFLSNISLVEREHLDPQPGIDLEGKYQILEEMTRRGGPGAARSARGSIGDLGMSSLQGPSTGS